MASVSAIQITNNALAQLGEVPLVSFDEGTQLSTTARDLWATAQDAVLEAHPWNFACFYAALRQLNDPPAWGWTYQYSLPTDPYCLRVLELEHNACFEIGADRYEGRVLLTDQATAHVRYIGRVDDLGHWNGLAVEALTKYIAACLAPLVTGQQTRKDALLVEFQKLLPAAQDRDSHEGTPHVVPPNRLLVGARLGLRWCP